MKTLALGLKNQKKNPDFGLLFPDKFRLKRIGGEKLDPLNRNCKDFVSKNKSRVFEIVYRVL